MARFPGTETPRNRAGLSPGALVRCRRARSNAELGLADARGLVVEVRLDHARVVFDAAGGGAWLPNEALLPCEQAPSADLALLGKLLVALRAERVEFEEDALVILSAGFAAAALDEARALVGERLLACELRAEGVHLLATRLRLAQAGPSRPPDL